MGVGDEPVNGVKGVFSKPIHPSNQIAENREALVDHLFRTEASKGSDTAYRGKKDFI